MPTSTSTPASRSCATARFAAARGSDTLSRVRFSGSTAYVQKGIRLNLREKASSSSDILGSFRGGTKVSVLKKGGYWSKVEVDGLTGYMANEYLTSEK